MTAALVLLALGVDKETAIADDVASNKYLHEMNEVMRAQVREQYGSMDAFFDALGVDREALSEAYLEADS